MIIQDKEGQWEAKCDICQWKTTQLKRDAAENKLRNHINIVHKNGVNKIKHKKRPTSKDNMPPRIPKAIKEN